MTRAISGLSVLGVLVLTPALASAQEELTGTNVVSYDFADFTGAGFNPTPAAGQLDSDEWIARGVQTQNLAFGGSAPPHEDFANGPSTGGETGGGIWAFTGVPSACGTGTRTLLGVQPSVRVFTPGAWRLRVRNATGASLDAVSIEYTFAYRNDEGWSMVHTLSVLEVDESGDEVTRTEVPSLAIETPAAAASAPEWVNVCQRANVALAAPIADGADLVITFDFDDGTGDGARDEVGITDVRVGTMPLTIVDAGTPDLDGGTRIDGGAFDGGAFDGGAIDAGALDGSVSLGDGGSRDGGAFDGGSARSDAGLRVDAGTGPSEGGCGCSAPKPAPDRSLWLVGLATAVAWRARRTRRTRGLG